MQPRSVVLATRSAGKIRELIPILQSYGIDAETLTTCEVPETSAEDDVEQFDTFELNALAKARYFAALLPGRVVLADDSGLVVDALQGRPGVASKRWSNRPDLSGDALDRANNEKLLFELQSVGASTAQERTARYVCAIACARDGDSSVEFIATGHCDGYILDVPDGDGGFGYDPYFWSFDLGKGFGVASRDEKARVGHRGRALTRLLREHQRFARG